MSELTEFLNRLYQDDEGVIYTPFRAKDGTFTKHFFDWPADCESLEAHITTHSPLGDVFLSPVLYSDRVFTFQSSNVVWCDFDSGVPSTEQFGDFPHPTIWVSSSDSLEKRHAYWELDHRIRDKEKLEEYNRTVAHAFGGDKVAWNYSRVLRPPTTLNHKYDPSRAVNVHQWSERLTSEFVFAMLPEVPRNDLGSLGWTWRTVNYHELLKGFRESLVAFFWQSEPEHRANALSSLAISAIEYGCERDGVMTLLDEAAKRWKKFEGRKDRDVRLKGIYQYALGVAAVIPVETDEPDYTSPLPLSKFTSHEFKIDWIIKDLLHQKGLAIVASPPGVGKTQFSLGLMLSMATGRDFLHWKITKPRKVLFVSMEMAQPELKVYLDQMTKDFSPEEKVLLDTNAYFVYRASFRLSSPANQAILLKWIDDLNPDGLILDSLSRCTSGDLEKTEIDTVFDYLNEQVRDKRNTFVWMVHHNRKANYMQKQPKKLEDMYGSQYIGAYASTVLGLWKISNQEVEVNCLKLWLAAPFDPFLVKRTSNLLFESQKKGLQFS